MDLSVPYYGLALLGTVQHLVAQLDPFIQIALVALAIALVSQGSALALAVGLSLAVYFRLWFLEAVPKTLTLGSSDEGDVSQLSNDVLLAQLKALDPDGKYPNLYGSPAIFHLLFQISFIRKLAKDAFERVLESADHYVEGSMQIRKTDNLNGVSVSLEQSIERAETLMQNYSSMALHVPLSSDRELSTRFKDTLTSLRIVLRRDLVALREIAVRHTNRGPGSYEPLPKIDAPRAWEG